MPTLPPASLLNGQTTTECFRRSWVFRCRLNAFVDFGNLGADVSNEAERGTMQRKAMVAAGMVVGLALSWGIGFWAVATQGSFSGSGSSISGTITFSNSAFNNFSHSAPHDGSDGNPAGWTYFKDDTGSKLRNFFNSKDQFLGSRQTPLDIGYHPEPVIVTEDVKLEIKAPEIKLNPEANAIVGKDTYAYVVDPKPQDLEVRAGGFSVKVRVTPVGYEWDWGDGAVTKSKEAGAPWPDGTVKHQYAKPGIYTVNCRVYWKGDWEVSGGDSGDDGDVEGDLFTDSSATPLEVRYLIPYLVAP